MPLGQGILDVFEAIPRRIEMTGHAPTWRITGASFEAVWEFAQEVIDNPVVVAREDRSRWWPRVTLTVTTDPARAADAPPLEELRSSPAVPEQRQPPPRQVALWNDAQYAESYSPLEEIFAHQEELRAARRDLPTEPDEPAPPRPPG